jgi:hypothetical protein
MEVINPVARRMNPLFLFLFFPGRGQVRAVEWERFSTVFEI